MRKILFCFFIFCVFSAEAAELPFSEAVRVGQTLYLSGQTGAETPEGTPVSGGIQGQTKQTMDNIKNTLHRYNLEMSNLKKCTIMLANIHDWENMNRVYATYFTNHIYPARTTFGNAGLAPGYLIQIDCIAAFPDPK